MNSIIKAASRLGARPIMDRVLLTKPIMISGNASLVKRWAHNQPLTYDFVRERVLLVVKLFDKVDPNKVTLDSHFINDLGLDSLDQVEIIMQLEDEFLFEIPDKDAEKLTTPGHILQYITDKEEAYKELQDLHAHHHHDNHHEGKHDDLGHHHGDSAGNHHDLNSARPQTRSFSSWAHMSKRFLSLKNPDGSDPIFPTSFGAKPGEEIKIEDVQARVMKVLSKYDKIDSSKLDLASHFVQDLGLDSLDHVEIMMELEDEFGLEIPDQEAEKLMRPAEVARYVFRQEEKRSLQAEDRPF